MSIARAKAGSFSHDVQAAHSRGDCQIEGLGDDLPEWRGRMRRTVLELQVGPAHAAEHDFEDLDTRRNRPGNAQRDGRPVNAALTVP